MIHTDKAELAQEVNAANNLIAKWYHFIKRNRDDHRGEELRLYIDPRLWHDYISLEFGHYQASHKVKMFGYVVHVYLVYGVEPNHSYMTFEDGCTT